MVIKINKNMNETTAPNEDYVNCLLLLTQRTLNKLNDSKDGVALHKS